MTKTDKSPERGSFRLPSDLRKMVDMYLQNHPDTTLSHLIKISLRAFLKENKMIIMTHDLRGAIADFKGNFPPNWRMILCKTLNVSLEDLTIMLATMELEDKKLGYILHE